MTHKLTKDNERFKLSIKQYFVDEYIRGRHRNPEEWYIVQEVLMCTHVGTHIESPYHHIKSGNDISMLNLKQLVGTATVIDVRVGESQPITMEHVIKYNNEIKEGDILLFRTGFSKYFRTEKYKNRPYIMPEVLSWLIEKKIKCLGVDCSGIENKKIKDQKNHIMLFERNIPLIEDLNNLDMINERRFFFLALPLNIIGLDASPIRAIGII